LRPDLLLRPERLHSTREEAAKREFLEVRRILEPEAAALAATRASAEEIGRLERDIELLREGVAAGYRPPEDLGFHLDVVRATHNTALTRLAGVIVSYYERDRMAPAQRDVAEHGDVLRAIGRPMLRHLAGEEQPTPSGA
jgi:DNA-binding FadR family transcriptional regulator